MSIWQKIKICMISGGMIAGMMSMLEMPVSAVKCGAGSLREGDEVTNVADCNVMEADEKQDLPSLVETVTNVLVAVLGIVTVVIIIYGGTQLVLSQGDPSKVKNGKMAIMAGVIGLIIAIMAWAIVQVVVVSIGATGGN